MLLRVVISPIVVVVFVLYYCCFSFAHQPSLLSSQLSSSHLSQSSSSLTTLASSADISYLSSKSNKLKQPPQQQQAHQRSSSLSSDSPSSPSSSSSSPAADSSTSQNKYTVVDPRLTLDCHRREYTYKASRTDFLGRQCWQYITVMSCWGRCDSGEVRRKQSLLRTCFSRLCYIITEASMNKMKDAKLFILNVHLIRINCYFSSKSC